MAYQGVVRLAIEKTFINAIEEDTEDEDSGIHRTASDPTFSTGPTSASMRYYNLNIGLNTRGHSRPLPPARDAGAREEGRPVSGADGRGAAEHASRPLAQAVQHHKSAVAGGGDGNIMYNTAVCEMAPTIQRFPYPTDVCEAAPTMQRYPADAVSPVAPPCIGYPAEATAVPTPECAAVLMPMPVAALPPFGAATGPAPARMVFPAVGPMGNHIAAPTVYPNFVPMAVSIPAALTMPTAVATDGGMSQAMAPPLVAMPMPSAAAMAVTMPSAAAMTIDGNDWSSTMPSTAAMATDGNDWALARNPPSDDDHAMARALPTAGAVARSSLPKSWPQTRGPKAAMGYDSQHHFHEETAKTGELADNRRQFTKMSFEGRLSVITEDTVRTRGEWRYLVQFAKGPLSNADGVGFIFSPTLPSPKNIQRIFSIFVNSTGRICIRAHSKVVRSDVGVKPISVGDWVKVCVDLDQQAAEFEVWPANGGKPSRAALKYGRAVEQLRISHPSLPQNSTSCGYFACVIKHEGVRVRLGS